MLNSLPHRKTKQLLIIIKPSHPFLFSEYCLQHQSAIWQGCRLCSGRGLLHAHLQNF